MARGIGDVLDAYFGVTRRATPALNLLVPLERGAWVASAVAMRLLERVDAGAGRIAIAPADPNARALVGAVAPRAPSGPIRVTAWLATRSPSLRPDCVLSLAPAPTFPASGGASDSLAGFTGPMSAIWLGDCAPVATGWLATIPERDALRAALGARPSEAFRRAAVALERWLKTLSIVS